MVAVNTTPLSLSEFSGLMESIGFFEPSPTVAIATSGGADSMALLLLANKWVEKNGGKLISLTVDHNLRNESKDEAKQVGLWCKNLAIEHHVLSWETESKPLSAIQEQARQARYKLLVEYCTQNNILHLLSGHHANDQIETMFFRLARGSGIEGLSSMSSQKIIAGIRLLRPFLSIQKSRLLATMLANDQQWVEDPSNQNSAYSRVYIRKQIEQHSVNTNFKYHTLEIIQKFGKTRNLLEKNLFSSLSSSVEIYPMGYAILHKDGLNQQVLAAITQTLSGAEHPPRSEKLRTLFNFLCSEKSKIKHSLAGLIFEKMPNNNFIIYREENAIEKPIVITTNNNILWDNRFSLNYNSDKLLKDNLQLRALGSEGIRQIKKNSPKLLRNLPPTKVLRTIPSLWLLEELALVPHIGYMSKQATVLDIRVNIQFCPAKPLAGSCFFIDNQS